MIEIEFVDGPLDGVVESVHSENSLLREMVVRGTHYLAWDVIALKDALYVQYVAVEGGLDATA